MYGRLPKIALDVQILPGDIELTHHKHEYLVKLRRHMKFMHQVTNDYLTTERKWSKYSIAARPKVGIFYQTTTFGKYTQKCMDYA